MGGSSITSQLFAAAAVVVSQFAGSSLLFAFCWPAKPLLWFCLHPSLHTSLLLYQKKSKFKRRSSKMRATHSIHSRPQWHSLFCTVFGTNPLSSFFLTSIGFSIHMPKKKKWENVWPQMDEWGKVVQSKSISLSEVAEESCRPQHRAVYFPPLPLGNVLWDQKYTNGWGLRLAILCPFTK